MKPERRIPFREIPVKDFIEEAGVRDGGDGGRGNIVAGGGTMGERNGWDWMKRDDVAEWNRWNT